MGARTILDTDSAALPRGDVARLAVVTVATRNHLHRVRALHASVALFLPDAHRCTVLVDRDDAGVLGAQPFELLPLDALPVPDMAAYLRRYSPAQLSFSAKPFVLAEMLRRGHERVLYLDSDILAHASLAPLVERLDAAAILLTPHRVYPTIGGSEVELTMLNAGTFNAGVVGVRACAEADAFLAWWQDKLLYHCIVDPERGLCGDQRWLDLVPGMFANVAIARDAGWNVGRWNVDERPVTRTASGYLAGGQPLLLFHYSGMCASPSTPRSRSDESGHALSPLVLDLVADYQRELLAQGQLRYEGIPFGRNAPPVPLGQRGGRVTQWLRGGLHRMTTVGQRRALRLWWKRRGQAS